MFTFGMTNSRVFNGRARPQDPSDENTSSPKPQYSSRVFKNPVSIPHYLASSVEKDEQGQVFAIHIESFPCMRGGDN